MAINVPIITSFDAKGISKAIADFKKLEGSALKTGFALNAIDQAATKVFVGLAKVGAGVAGIGALAVREFASFDAAMTESTAIMGDLSSEMRTEMEQAARQMGKTSLFSATQAAQAYFFLASAGMDASASIKALPVVTQFAQAGMFDLEQATSLLADAQSALGLTIRDDAVANMENMARVADVLVKGNIMANASVEQLSQSLTNKAASAMKSVGMAIEEGVAVLSAFADQGIKGDEAGTRFAIVLRELQRRALENRKAFDQFNVTVFDGAGNLNNMADIIGDLEKALAGQSDESKKAILSMMGFAEESVTVLLSLIGTSDQIRKYEEGLRSASGITQEVADKQLGSLSSQLQLAKQRLQDVAIEIGGKLAPSIIKLTDFFSQLIEKVGNQGLGGAIEFVVAKFASFYSGLGTLGKTILTVVGAFTTLRIAMTLYNSAMALGQIAVTTFGASLQTVSGIALGFSGVFTALIASAGLIYAIYAKRKQEATQVTNGFTEALKLEGQAQNEALIALANNNDKARTFLDALSSLKMEFADVNEFVKTGAGRLATMAETFERVTDEVNGAYPEIAALYEALTGATLAGDTLNQKYQNMTEQQRLFVYGAKVLFEELGNLRSEELKLAASTQLVDGLMGEVATSTAQAGNAARGSSVYFNALTKRLFTTADAAERVISAMNPLAGIGALERTISSGGGAVRSAQERLEDYISAIRTWERQSYSVEDAQRALVDAQNAQLDATQSLADAQDYYNKVLRGFARDSKEVIDAQERLVDAQYRFRDAQMRTKDAQDALIEAQKRYQALFDPANARTLQEATDKVTEAQFRLSDAQKELERIERRRFPNQRALAEAQIAVREATWTLADAQAELTDLQDGPTEQEVAQARRDIEEATWDLQDAQRSELDALNELNSAQSDLNELINGATEDSDRYKDAVERLEEAKRREADAINDVAKALRNQRDALLELREAEGQVSEARGEVRGNRLNADIAAYQRTGIMSPALQAELNKVDWNAFTNWANRLQNNTTTRMPQASIVGERGTQAFNASTNLRPTTQTLTGTTNVTVNVSGSVTSENDLVESIRRGLLNTQRSGRTLVLS